MIREATINDMGMIVPMCIKFIAVSPYSKLCNIMAVANTIAEVIKAEDGVVYLYEDKGMIGGICKPFIYGYDNIATEIGWWVEPDYRATGVGGILIESLENWAISKGCAALTMISIDDELHKYYEHKGYKLCERAYLKEL